MELYISVLFWYYYSTLEKYVGKKCPPKNKHLFASFNNDRRLRLEDKTNDYVDINIGGQVCSLHEVTQLGYCDGIAYLSGRTKKIISRKLKYIFTKKLHHNY